MAGKAAFLEAVRNHRAADVAEALKAQPNLVAVADKKGRLPLHECARQKVTTPARARASVATARALVGAGADVDAVQPIRDEGEIFPATALWYALAWGRNRVLARYLLKLGADPNHCLFALVWADDLVAARMLVPHGPDLDELAHGETPLIYAVRHRRAKFAEWLVKQGADATIRDRRGASALRARHSPPPSGEHGESVDAGRREIANFCL